MKSDYLIHVLQIKFGDIQVLRTIEELTKPGFDHP